MFFSQCAAEYIAGHKAEWKGEKHVKLWKGTLSVTKRLSPYSLYRADLASFTMGRYNPKDAEGFINLFALPVTVRPKAKAEGGNKS